MDLYSACIYGHFDYIKQRVNEENINQLIYEDNTILMLACRFEQLKIVEFLLQFKNIDLEKQNSKLDTALHYASMFASKECVRMLLKKQKNIDQKNDLGFTPFSYACSILDSIDLLKIFLKRKVKLNDFKTAEPLWNAFLYRKDDFIKLLLIHGAKIKSDQYKSNKIILEFLEDKKIVRKWEAEFDQIGELFFLIIMNNDGYFESKDRFFKICSLLPIEVIMRIANLVHDGSEIFINSHRVNIQLENLK